MNITMEKITPRKAEEYLGKNQSNRNVRSRRVDFYANEMLNGRWKETLQGISFFEDGTLADGQHRLLAIIRSGCSLTLPVARGIKKDAMAAIDVGAIRNTADFLHLHHGVKNANLTAATTKSIINILISDNYIISGQLSLSVLDTYGGQIEYAISEIAKAKPLRRGWIVAAMAIALRSHPEVSEFLSAITTGDNLKAHSPELTCRNWLLTSRIQGMADVLRAERALLMCIYHYIMGNPVQKIGNSLRGLNYFRKQECEFIEQMQGDLILQSRTGFYK